MNEKGLLNSVNRDSNENSDICQTCEFNLTEGQFPLPPPMRQLSSTQDTILLEITKILGIVCR